MAGYHKAKIMRGLYGYASKIREECDEFMDAHAQINPVMAICELADLVGAIEGWLENYHPSIGFQDLLVMARATRRAFEDGTRKPREGS